MDKFLSKPTKEIVINFCLLLGLIIVCYITRWIWRNVFRKIAQKTPTKLDVKLVEYTEKPVIFLLFFIGIRIIAERILSLPEISSLKFIPYIKNSLYALIVLSIAFLASAFAEGFAVWYLEEIAYKTKTKMDEEFMRLFRRLSKIVIFFIAITIILDKFNQPITSLLGAAGIASLAVAFAAQETLSNMIAGFVIMIDKPFRVGDRIELSSGEIGDVVEIGLRSTKILSFDNNVIVVPNAEIAKAKIVNYGYPEPKMKLRFTVGVAYGSDLNKVKRIILDICKRHPDVLDTPPPSVFFTEFGESSLNLLIVCWIQNYQEKFRIIDEINMEIKKRFEEENIEIPFPQRDIHIR